MNFRGENMKNKPTLIILIMIFLTSSTFSYVAGAEIAEDQMRLAWSLEDASVIVEVYATAKAYPGDNITIRVNVNATKNLKNVYITFWIFGSTSQGYSCWSVSRKVLEDDTLDPGEPRSEPHNVTIPSYADPGLIYSRIRCEWRILEYHCEDDWFTIAYLKNKGYENLQREYEELNSSFNKLSSNYQKVLEERDQWETSYEQLNSTYHSLDANYTELELKYEASSGELGSARRMMYIFIVTTIISAATAVFFVIRKPKEEEIF